MSTSPAVSLKSQEAPDPRARLRELYRAHRDVVWRNLLMLGVPESGADEALQDVFLTVHRRRDDFDDRRDIRAWIFGITRRVAANHRRHAKRRETSLLIDPEARTPPLDEAFARLEAARLVERFVLTLSLEQREVFVAIDIEGLTAPEVAEAVGTNLNTIYSRLRLARRRFEREVARHRASERGGGGND